MHALYSDLTNCFSFSIFEIKLKTKFKKGIKNVLYIICSPFAFNIITLGTACNSNSNLITELKYVFFNY